MVIQTSLKIYDRVSSNMLANSIEVSIENASLKKLLLHQGGYEWSYTGGIKSNYRPNRIYLRSFSQCIQQI